MVVLAASICTRGGKALLSRQFKDLSKERVVSLLSSFPTLISDSSKNQHTTVEDEHVRYVYQALEEYYVVLITNRQSNILQDIDTLHLFSQSITSILSNVDEREIFANCFEILSLFDEIVNMGYKENLTLSQIHTFLEMDSHEERIQELIERNKELEAAEERKRKAIEIKKRESRKKDEYQQGLLSDSNHYGQQQQQQQQYYDNSYNQFQQPVQPVQQVPQIQQQQNNQFRQSAIRGGSGLQLDSRSNRPAFGDNHPTLISTQRQTSTQYQQQHQQQQQQQTINTPAIPVKEKVKNDGVLISITEKYTGEIDREGNILSSEVKGDLQLRINKSELTQFKVNLELNKNKDLITQYKTHPDIDKVLFNSTSIIGLKNPNKPFPSNDQSVCVLRWRSIPNTNKINNEENLILPIMLTTWINFNEEEQTCSYTFEYELLNNFINSKLIKEISLILPITNGIIENDENDNIKLEYTSEGIIIELTKLDEFSNGTFEISSNEIDDQEKIFPIEIEFNTIDYKIIKEDINNIKFGEVSIKSVKFQDSEEDVPYDLYYNGSSEGLYIV